MRVPAAVALGLVLLVCLSAPSALAHHGHEHVTLCTPPSLARACVDASATDACAHGTLLKEDVDLGCAPLP